MNLKRDHLPWERKKDMFWVCPECGTVNAYNWDDAERASKKLKQKVTSCTGSCFDNICGHCHRNIVNPDSPILAEVYTHIPVEA